MLKIWTVFIADYKFKLVTHVDAELRWSVCDVDIFCCEGESVCQSWGKREYWVLEQNHRLSPIKLRNLLLFLESPAAPRPQSAFTFP